MFKKVATYVMAVVLGAGLLATAQVVSQEEKEQAMPSPEEMMKMWEQMNMPGPEHERFKDAIGTWDTITKMWMGPGDPQVSKGISETEVIFGGRYLKEHFRCDMDGKPFEGIALAGYDNHEKKYVSVWLDNMSTGIMMMEGTYDEATNTMTLMGEYDDPFMGPSKMKSVMRELSTDMHLHEMYRIGSDGREQKEMEITYTRKK